MRKYLITITTCIMVFCTSVPVCFAQSPPTSDCNDHQSVAIESEQSEQPTLEQEIILRKDDIRWRYKVVNGDLYRRKFNYTTRTWIGKWQRV